MTSRFLLAIVMLLAGPRIADACSCVEMPTCQRFWAADAVFTGVVTNVTSFEEKGQRLSRTTIVVERGFKGESGEFVFTANELSSCHYPFSVGERYLVHGHRLADGSLTTGACAGNKVLTHAVDDIDYAERPPPPGSGGRIFGRVRRIEENLLDRRKQKDTYPADIAITLRNSRGTSLDTRTDTQGRFEASGLEADTYSVSMDAPATARVYYYPTTIELKDRACVPVTIAYQSNGRIAGRIVDASGVPVSKVPVSAFPSVFTTKKEYPDVTMQTKRTDADGRYEIGPLPPGEYHVGVNAEWPPILDWPYPPTYHPGVLSRAEAETITVREGQMRQATFMLPRTLTRVTVGGIVVFTDGTPASGVNVTLVAPPVTGLSTARTNAAGQFTLTGLSGSTYVVRASFYESPENSGSAELTISLADEPVGDVKLVLKKR